ncbi:hypothetical protein FE257_007000 [Aspergillus nanangensis]|uniref:BHLH domain-containing protein n=1 Tax=Aspergillus nanangensis TaxID=2582783 RepID=A0AAD4GTL7_ASPNN|nr:hypothetical protein FE257_007000 [Aspergillus nanangensis]
MSRSRLPPTPAMSGEFIIKEQMPIDGADSFALPPAALNSSKLDSASRRSSKSVPSSAYFPASPASPDLGPERIPQPTRQSGAKRPLEDFDLPPPPTRTRKIIQMKPKTQSSPKAATAASKASSKDNNKNQNNANGSQQTTNNKKKQPSATSAAGRKIARKTAHSLIERRRRSKMNEEFGTLKDMIPACRGQDMHKLAILQASIDYVNYLEKCIQDLKTAGDGHQQPSAPPRMALAPPSPTSPDVFEVARSMYSASVSPNILPNGHQATMTSPAFSPRSHAVSGASIEPTPSILPSPALGPTYPTESMFRGSCGSWGFPSSSNTSPVIQPDRSASAADVDHEASAALLMLNRDCRQSIGSLPEDQSSPGSLDDARVSVHDAQRKTGMSVKDLLIS